MEVWVHMNSEDLKHVATDCCEKEQLAAICDSLLVPLLVHAVVPAKLNSTNF